MPKEKIYLAYGSNLNLAQMAQRCPTAKRLGTAMLDGYGLEFRGQNGHAVATIDPGPSSVPALLWRIKPQDEESLDVYEGWPHFYRKETVDVELDGKPVSAMVYIMNDGYDLAAPDSYYLHSIREGYQAAGFDEAALDAAVALSQQVQNARIAEYSNQEEAFCEKLKDNFEEHETQWRRMKRNDLISKAADVALVQRVYSMLQHGNYAQEIQEYLLQFENPLEVVLDKWRAEYCFEQYGELSDLLEELIMTPADEYEYALDPAYTAQTEPELEM